MMPFDSGRRYVEATRGGCRSEMPRRVTFSKFTLMQVPIGVRRSTQDCFVATLLERNRASVMRPPA